MNKMGCGRLGRCELIVKFSENRAHRTLWGFSVGVFFLLAQPLSQPLSAGLYTCFSFLPVFFFCYFARMFSGSLAAPARLRSCLAFRPLMLLQSRLLSSLLFSRETLFMRVAACYYSSCRWAGRHNLAAWRPPSALRGAWMRSLKFLSVSVQGGRFPAG